MSRTPTDTEHFKSYAAEQLAKEKGLTYEDFDLFFIKNAGSKLGMREVGKVKSNEYFRDALQNRKAIEEIGKTKKKEVYDEFKELVKDEKMEPERSKDYTPEFKDFLDTLDPNKRDLLPFNKILQLPETIYWLNSQPKGVDSMEAIFGIKPRTVTELAESGDYGAVVDLVEDSEEVQEEAKKQQDINDGYIPLPQIENPDKDVAADSGLVVVEKTIPDIMMTDPKKMMSNLNPEAPEFVPGQPLNVSPETGLNPDAPEFVPASVDVAGVPEETQEIGGEPESFDDGTAPSETTGAVEEGKLSGRASGDYADPIHKSAIYTFFGMPIGWDQTLTKSLNDTRTALGSSSTSTFLKESQEIVKKFGVDILVFSLKYGAGSSADLIFKEHLEIVQLYFSLKRNMMTGERVPTAGIPLGELIKFRDTLSGETVEEPVEEPVAQPQTVPTLPPRGTKLSDMGFDIFGKRQAEPSTGFSTEFVMPQTEKDKEKAIVTAYRNRRFKHLGTQNRFIVASANEAVNAGIQNQDESQKLLMSSAPPKNPNLNVNLSSDFC